MNQKRNGKTRGNKNSGAKRSKNVSKAVRQAVNQVAAAAKSRNNKPKKQKLTSVGSLLRTAGRVAGGFIGNASLGEAAGGAISKIFGQGDYTVQSNSLTHGGPPSFANLGSGIRMAHREYVGDVFSSTDFQNTTYDINVVSSATFPWLSRIAANFEEYEIKGLVFYFNTTCGNAISSTNNSLGTVGMTTVYDPTDLPLGTKRECEDYSGCVAGVPSCSLLHPVECKPSLELSKRYYIQTNSLANPEDRKFYSKGTLNLFTQGMQQAGVIIGELWVSYDVEFYIPKILPIGTLGMVASAGYSTWSATGAEGTNVFGYTSQTMQGNLGVTYAQVGSDGVFTIPRGTAAGWYQAIFFLSTQSTTAAVDTCRHLSSNLVQFNSFSGNSKSQLNGPNAANANAFHAITYMLNKTDTNAATFCPAFTTALAAGSTGCDALIVKLPSSAVGQTSYLTLQKYYKQLEDEVKEKALYDRIYRQLHSEFFEEDSQEEEDHSVSFSDKIDYEMNHHQCKYC